MKVGIEQSLWGWNIFYNCLNCTNSLEKNDKYCSKCGYEIDWNDVRCRKPDIDRHFRFSVNNGEIYINKRKIKSSEQKCKNCIYYFSGSFSESFWSGDFDVIENTCGYKQDRKPFDYDNINDCEDFKLSFKIDPAIY